MLSDLQCLRELLDSRVISITCWTDPRDMVADGATKGSVDREFVVHTCMGGSSVINHAIKLWKAKGKIHSVDNASASAAHLQL